jgi:hypothetical protein
MENGLNFGKATEAAKTGKKEIKQETGWNECSHT